MTRKVEKEKEMEIKPVLSMLGPRPGSEAVEAAKQAVALIDRRLAVESTAEDLPVERQKELREAAEREKLPYMAVIQLETLHQSYEELVKDSSAQTPTTTTTTTMWEADFTMEIEKELSAVAAKKTDHFDCSGRALKSLPRSLTSASFLASLNLSNNEMEALPSAIGSLGNLVVLCVQSNHLKTLPDSIGNLWKLTILNVSGNHLKSFPESLGKCR